MVQVLGQDDDNEWINYVKSDLTSDLDYQIRKELDIADNLVESVSLITPYKSYIILSCIHFHIKIVYFFKEISTRSHQEI